MYIYSLSRYCHRHKSEGLTKRQARVLACPAVQQHSAYHQIAQLQQTGTIFMWSAVVSSGAPLKDVPERQAGKGKTASARGSSKNNKGRQAAELPAVNEDTANVDKENIRQDLLSCQVSMACRCKMIGSVICLELAWDEACWERLCLCV